MQDPFSDSNTNKLSEFLYTDNSDSGHGAVIFRCNAATLEEADKMFQEEKHYDPKIDANIGCMKTE